jgi:hypothetical protein
MSQIKSIGCHQTNLDDIRNEIQLISEDVKRIQEGIATMSATVSDLENKTLEIWISTMDPDSQLGVHLLEECEFH